MFAGGTNLDDEIRYSTPACTSNVLKTADVVLALSAYHLNSSTDSRKLRHNASQITRYMKLVTLLRFCDKVTPCLSENSDEQRSCVTFRPSNNLEVVLRYLFKELLLSLTLLAHKRWPLKDHIVSRRFLEHCGYQWGRKLPTRLGTQCRLARRVSGSACYVAPVVRSATGCVL